MFSASKFMKYDYYLEDHRFFFFYLIELNLFDIYFSIHI